MRRGCSQSWTAPPPALTGAYSADRAGKINQTGSPSRNPPPNSRTLVGALREAPAPAEAAIPSSGGGSGPSPSGPALSLPKSHCGIEGLRGGVRFCIFINVSTPDSQASTASKERSLEFFRALQTMIITSAIKGLLRVREASAHCDIPCGVYDPISAKIAAQTVLKMVMRIDALDGEDVAAAQFALPLHHLSRKSTRPSARVRSTSSRTTTSSPSTSRRIPICHRRCGPPQDSRPPTSRASASNPLRQLVDAVDEIASIYWATKGVEYSDPVAAVRLGT